MKQNGKKSPKIVWRISELNSTNNFEEKSVKTTIVADKYVDDSLECTASKVIVSDKTDEEFEKISKAVWSRTSLQYALNASDLELFETLQDMPRYTVRLLYTQVDYDFDNDQVKVTRGISVDDIGLGDSKLFVINTETPLDQESKDNCIIKEINSKTNLPFGFK